MQRQVLTTVSNNGNINAPKFTACNLCYYEKSLEGVNEECVLMQRELSPVAALLYISGRSPAASLSVPRAVLRYKPRNNRLHARASFLRAINDARNDLTRPQYKRSFNRASAAFIPQLVKTEARTIERLCMSCQTYAFHAYTFELCYISPFGFALF